MISTEMRTLSCLAVVARNLACMLTPTVSTRFGIIQGFALPGVDEFLGIPYAEPPRRFADPVDWTAKYPNGTWKATNKPSVCVQPVDKAQTVWTGSEDCLYLNVWRPSAVSDAEKLADSLPVLLFIHGGSFLIGDGSQYNASTLAFKHRALYVTTNYRLGALGFAQVAPGRGNFGLKDQRSAMRWVSNHIRSFRGDASRVLIFGESSGAMSVAHHLLYPPPEQLFHAALMQSGMAQATFQSAALAVKTVSPPCALPCLTPCMPPRRAPCNSSPSPAA